MAGELAITQPATHAWSAVNPQSTDAAIQQDLLTPEQALAIACSVPVTSAPSMNAGNSSQNRLGRRGVKLPDHEKHQLAAVFSEYGQIKKLRQVTKNDYASYGKEMVEFWGNRDIRTLVERDISDLIIHLRSAAGNDPRTIDNKTGYVRAVINFLVKHGRHPGPNPASDKNLVSKREKRKAGTKPFAYNDLKVVFGGEEFRRYGGQRPEIYLICMVGLVTGMRVSSVARLTAADLKRSMHGTPYIDISNDKTIAGNRDIPIPELLSTALGKFFDGHDDFGLQEREDGKGYPNRFLRSHRAASTKFEACPIPITRSIIDPPRGEHVHTKRSVFWSTRNDGWRSS
jgi:integrase